MERRSTQVLLGLIACLLALNLLRGDPLPVAQAGPGEAGASHLFALTAPGLQNGQNVLYVLDPGTDRLLVYDDHAKGKLTLRAVRNMFYEKTRFEQWPTKDRKGKHQWPPIKAFKKK